MGQFTIGTTIFTKLSLDTTVTGFVGTSPARIFPDVAPLNVSQTFPYIVYSIISQVPTNTKGPSSEGNATALGPQKQRSPLDIVRVQVSSYSNSYSQGVVLADSIRATLDRGIGSGFKPAALGPEIDSIIYDGMTTDYESKIKPQGVYEFTQEYIVRIINTDISPSFVNTYSLNFDGVDDYVTIGDDSIFSFGNGTTDSPFSVSLWARFNTVSSSIGLMGKDSGGADAEYQLRLGYNNFRISLIDNVTGGSITKSLDQAFSTGIWYHLVCTYNGSGSNTGLKIYQNASIPAQTNGTAGTYVAMSDTAADLTMGVTDGATFMDGNLDEVTMFDIELSAAQVLAIYNLGTPKSEASHTGLIGWWRNGDSGAYPVINDNSTNNNPGTMTNMVSSDIENLIP